MKRRCWADAGDGATTRVLFSLLCFPACAALVRLWVTWMQVLHAAAKAPASEPECPAEAAPRWAVEALSGGGAGYRAAAPPRPPACPPGEVPNIVKTYSRSGQDAAALRRYFWGVTDGIFIEVGAFAGLRHSNTKMLEDHLGWGGLVVEPAPLLWRVATAARPRAAVAQAACGAAADPAGVPLRGGPRGEGRDAEGGAAKWDGATPRVPLVTLAALTERLGCGRPLHVDFLSVDTGGDELAVLRGFDWRQATVGVLVMATSRLTNRTLAEAEALLAAAGGLRRDPGAPHTPDGVWYVSAHGEERRRSGDGVVAYKNMEPALAQARHGCARAHRRGESCRVIRGDRARRSCSAHVLCWHEEWSEAAHSHCLSAAP